VCRDALEDERFACFSKQMSQIKLCLSGYVCTPLQCAKHDKSANCIDTAVARRSIFWLLWRKCLMRINRAASSESSRVARATRTCCSRSTSTASSPRACSCLSGALPRRFWARGQALSNGVVHAYGALHLQVVAPLSCLARLWLPICYRARVQCLPLRCYAGTQARQHDVAQLPAAVGRPAGARGARALARRALDVPRSVVPLRRGRRRTRRAARGRPRGVHGALAHAVRRRVAQAAGARREPTLIPACEMLPAFVIAFALRSLWRST
jgi:hypothetical protein